MNQDEIDRVKMFIQGLDYDGLKLKRYTGKLYDDFRLLRDVVKGVDRVIGCELIKADLIPFTLLLKYAEQSEVLRGILRSRV